MANDTPVIRGIAYAPQTPFFKTIFPTYLDLMKERFDERKAIKLERKLEPVLHLLQLLVSERSLKQEYAFLLASDLLEIIRFADINELVSESKDLTELQKNVRERMFKIQTSLGTYDQ